MVCMVVAIGAGVAIGADARIYRNKFYNVASGPFPSNFRLSSLFFGNLLLLNRYSIPKTAIFRKLSSFFVAILL